MAAKFNPTQLKYLLECSICLNRFNNPRMLPCLHSYCLKCLYNHITSTKTKDGMFECPECRQTSTIPKGGVQNFSKNFFVNSLKDVVPASLFEQFTSEVNPGSGSATCKHSTKENQHGEAVVFCVQCDAHLCESCSNHHKLFDAIKDHKLTPLVAKSGLEVPNIPNCELHKDLKISWYCKPCSLPACADCIIEKHKIHDTVRISTIDAECKNELFDISKLAAKRVEFLGQILKDTKDNEIKMEQDLDQASKDISDTADNMCKLIRQHEVVLQEKVKEVRTVARTQFTTAKETPKLALKNTSKLMSTTESLHQAGPEYAIYAVLQTPVNRRQFMHYQDSAVPDINWKMNRDLVELCVLSKPNILGSCALRTFEESKSPVLPKNIMLGSPNNAIKLEYMGKYPVCGIAPIYTSMTCVAYFGEPDVLVYDAAGQLKHKIQISGIDKIYGLATVESSHGKLAIVDGEQSKVHFVTLSEDCRERQHYTKDVPHVPWRLGVSYNKKLVISDGLKNCAVVSSNDGQILSKVRLSIPHDTVNLGIISQTDSGFVAGDIENGKVYFTDVNGHMLHTYSECKQPLSTASTSWGSSIVVDASDSDIKLLNEAGDFLGNVRDESGIITRANCIYVDEAEKRLYISRGTVGEREIRIYKYAISDLMVLPVKKTVSTLAIDLTLGKV